MREFAAAALESIPGVAACSFVDSESAPGSPAATPVRRGGKQHEDGYIDSEYAVTLQTISGSYGQVVLELDDREQFREFEAAVHNFLGSLAMRLDNFNYQQHLEERVKEQTAELKQAVKDKELLLREIHHRVKNSLNAVMGLLQMQFAAFEDETVQNAVNASVDRIQSTALVHEFLYKSDSLDSLDLHAFVERVVHELMCTYDPGGKVEIRTDIQDIHVGIHDAVPLSLIVTEVITNALKYAFPNGRRGHISIQTRVLDANFAELQIRDNGIGLPENFDLSGIDSLGMQLVQALTAQIDGSMELSSRDGDSGTSFQLRFPQHGHRA